MIAAQMLIAMYIFELVYRTKISPISIVHHIGTIMVGQSAIAISLNLVHEKDADIEFILCTVWGMIPKPYLHIMSEFYKDPLVIESDVTIVTGIGLLLQAHLTSSAKHYPTSPSSFIESTQRRIDFCAGFSVRLASRLYSALF